MTTTEHTSRCVLVTGGASGIGKAAAMRMARDGWRVAIADIGDGAQALAQQLRASGSRGVAVACDVGDAAQVAAAFALARDTLGPVDALVHAAGVDTFRPVPFAATQDGDIDRIVRVNVLGTLYCCREAARYMGRASGGAGGCIVNVSSMASTIGGRPGKTVYGTSKGAVDALTKGLARELAPEGIRVNAVRPGATRTPMVQAFLDDPAYAQRITGSIPLGRIAEPHEVAEAIAWLCSDGASFVSGALLDISGGGFSIAG